MQLEGPAFKVASCLPLKDPNDLCSLSDTRKQPAGWGQEGDPAFTLRTAVVPGVALAFAQNQLGEVRAGEVFNTINTNSNASGRNTPMVAFPANMSATQTASTEGVACNLQARNPTVVASALQVRRLTPIECERLQGFPDSYTNVPHRGKPAADGPRYKALGNSMAVPCMRWIGERIQMVEAIKESVGGAMWNL